MIYANSNSYFTVWRGDIKEKYAEFSLSTSRKDKRTDEYKNSNWSFVRFVGEAFDKAKGLRERDRITNLTFGMDAEPYVDRDGVTQYPKSPRITVFSFEMAENGGGARTGGTGGRRSQGKPQSKPYAQEENYDDSEDSDDELPF